MLPSFLVKSYSNSIPHSKITVRYYSKVYHTEYYLLEITERLIHD